jgi:hypothetical protein
MLDLSKTFVKKGLHRCQGMVFSPNPPQESPIAPLASKTQLGGPNSATARLSTDSSVSPPLDPSYPLHSVRAVGKHPTRQNRPRSGQRESCLTSYLLRWVCALRVARQGPANFINLNLANKAEETIRFALNHSRFEVRDLPGSKAIQLPAPNVLYRYPEQANCK